MFDAERRLSSTDDLAQVHVHSNTERCGHFNRDSPLATHDQADGRPVRSRAVCKLLMAQACVAPNTVQLGDKGGAQRPSLAPHPLRLWTP